jgi:replicative DNA helicase Mcm
MLQFYRKYYRDEIGELAQHYPREQRSLYIEADDLYRHDPELLDEWVDYPEQTQQYAEEALRLFDLPADISLKDAHVRLTDHADAIGARAIPDLNPADDIGDYVAVRGQLNKVTETNPRLTEATFECKRCGTKSYIPQGRNSTQEPHECSGCERQGPFSLAVDESTFVDQRKVQLAELPGERPGTDGETLPVITEDDLCDYGGANGLPDRAGETAVVLGKLRVDESKLTGRNSSPETEPWIDAHAIAFESDDYDDVDVDAHREAFEELAAREDTIEQLRDSIAPQILADDELEIALEAAVAWLFNAWRIDNDRGTFRGDLHFGLIGDPGRGKSTILSRLAKIAPKSEYRSGTGLSKVGLTAAAVQEEFAGKSEWTLQPGILPRANGGHCIIDEVDDVVDEQTKAMHDALEGDQILTFDKAGISAELPTRTALLVSGNPVHGRFDRHEPIADQIDMDDALIDRMDVLLAVQDIPDPEVDADLADHVLESWDDAARQELADRGVDIKEPEQTTVDPPVSVETFRAMLVYARENVFPLPTDAAKDLLKESYVDIRTLNDEEGDPVSATPRRLEAGLRLAAAFARAELSETIEPRHAERAIKITKNVVGLNFDPETGKFDADRTGKGTPQSQKERIRAVRDLVSELETRDAPADIDDILTEAQEELNLAPTKVEDTLETMYGKGEIYEPAHDAYRVS